MIAPVKKSTQKSGSLFFIQPKFALPCLIFLCVLMVGLRVNDMWNTLASGKIFNAVTVARAASDAPPKDAAPQIKSPAASPAAPSPTPAAVSPDAKASSDEVSDRHAADKPEAESSSSEMALIKELSERRGQLDKRAHELDTRESLTRVAEQRIDQKIKEMETLRQQLQAMVNQASAAQQVQLDNLVKIYETMKPKEAAKIFETLELPVMLGVVQKMKPARTAAIMAEMNTEKAKEITVALTRQDQLPQVK